jgi:undecaprenyl-diphosphatase
MTVAQAFILGLVQGVTEFLPISSSGFLVLIPELFGWEVQSVTFDAFVHIATLAAVVLALWPEVKQIAGAFLGNRSAKHAPAFRRLAQWVVLATIPVMAAGYLMQKVWEVDIRSAAVVAWSFIIWGAVLYIADQNAKKSKEEVQEVGWKRSLMIGLAQMIALIPGTSRSPLDYSPVFLEKPLHDSHSSSRSQRLLLLASSSLVTWLVEVKRSSYYH